ncbi:MAG: hypothetical protein LC107_00235 [Chitinophagales bacterium]|nr:hypothetical protein [Chitinophagales bacterium]
MTQVTMTINKYYHTKSSFNRHIWLGLMISWMFMLSSCSTMVSLKSHLVNSNCSQKSDYHYTVEDLPLPMYQVRLDAKLSARFSTSSLKMANAIHLQDQLTAYLEAENNYRLDPNLENRVTILELSNAITQRINTASLEVSSIASEIDCEKESVAQIADFMKSSEAAKETKLTVAAIAVGAIGTLVGAPLIGSHVSDKNLNLVTLGTAIAEGSLGLMILLNEKKVEIHHPRNLLKAIWEAHETSSLFPPFIWYYLNYYDPDKPNQNSLRYQLIQSWISFGQIQEKSPKKKQAFIDLNFGNGGIYTADQLYNRANMLDQLESVIKLIKQDLTHLSHEFEILNLK